MLQLCLPADEKLEPIIINEEFKVPFLISSFEREIISSSGLEI